eukprot:CAMPEP_0119126258 /NCGR_PEP_ID=MMETSP1310-20130426/5248_1 /TAXON_ID=464262 /ORGANISM="Genus nov. species nov., Strain RCC2339" /LENGTH=715 /DNA_ID=CAMNT_0007116411 /DNA_START=103 /DNA_END=2250 /DNA_ORIENTATION=-
MAILRRRGLVIVAIVLVTVAVWELPGREEEGEDMGRTAADFVQSTGVGAGRDRDLVDFANVQGIHSHLSGAGGVSHERGVLRVDLQPGQKRLARIALRRDVEKLGALLPPPPLHYPYADLGTVVIALWMYDVTSSTGVRVVERRMQTLDSMAVTFFVNCQPGHCPSSSRRIFVSSKPSRGPWLRSVAALLPADSRYVLAWDAAADFSFPRFALRRYLNLAGALGLIVSQPHPVHVGSGRPTVAGLCNRGGAVPLAERTQGIDARLTVFTTPFFHWVHSDAAEGDGDLCQAALLFARNSDGGDGLAIPCGILHGVVVAVNASGDRAWCPQATCGDHPTKADGVCGMPRVWSGAEIDWKRVRAEVTVPNRTVPQDRVAIREPPGGEDTVVGQGKQHHGVRRRWRPDHIGEGRERERNGAGWQPEENVGGWRREHDEVSLLVATAVGEPELETFVATVGSYNGTNVRFLANCYEGERVKARLATALKDRGLGHMMAAPISSRAGIKGIWWKLDVTPEVTGRYDYVALVDSDVVLNQNWFDMRLLLATADLLGLAIFSPVLMDGRYSAKGCNQYEGHLPAVAECCWIEANAPFFHRDYYNAFHEKMLSTAPSRLLADTTWGIDCSYCGLAEQIIRQRGATLPGPKRSCAVVYTAPIFHLDTRTGHGAEAGRMGVRSMGVWQEITRTNNVSFCRPANLPPSKEVIHLHQLDWEYLYNYEL